MKKGWKIAGIVIIVLILLFFGVQWWLGYKIKNVLKDKLAEKTNGTMQVEVGKVDVRLISRAVYLEDIRITTDSTRQLPPDFPFNYVKGHIRELLISGIHFKKQDSLMNIEAGKLELEVEKLFMRMPDPEKHARKTAGARKTQKLQVALDDFRFRVGNLSCDQVQDRDTVSYQLEKLSCRITDVQLDTRKDTVSDPLTFGEIRLSFEQFRNLFAGKSQLLEVDSLDLRGEEGYFSLASVRLLPQYPKAVFAEKSPGHTDWTRIVTDRIVFRHFDVGKMWREKKIEIDSVEIEGAQIASYKNRQIEQRKKVKRLFYESVQEVPVPFRIHKVNLDRINVEYQELSERGLSPGTITFNGLNGVFDDLTNIVTKDHPYFTLKAQGKLMDQGLLQATFFLPVDSTDNRFEVEGSLGPMSCLSLNPMIEPLAKIKITSGEIEGMTFKITGNSRDSRVNMEFLYSDLKIRIMKEKDGHLKTSSFLTTLANGLIAKGNNPDHRGVRKAEGKAERDIYRSQFNYLWRSLLAGLKETLGI